MTPPCNIVTVVVPVFNRGSLVIETLRSIAAQTALPALIIVDNNSTDNTFQAITQWAAENATPPFPVKILSEPCRGAAKARNLGLSHVTTPWTLFFDSDDIMHPLHIQNILTAIAATPSANLIGWNTLTTNLSGHTTVKRFPRTRHLWHNIFNGTMSTQQYAATTALFRQASGWNPRLTGWDDYELGMRLLLHRPHIARITSAPTVHIRCHPDSITGTSFSATPRKWEDSLDSCQGIFLQATMPRHARYINLKRAVLAALYKKEGDTKNSRRLIRTVIANEPNPMRRALLRFAIAYTAAGGQGIHWLLTPFI